MMAMEKVRFPAKEQRDFAPNPLELCAQQGVANQKFVIKAKV
jgi:hypothetical protein